MYTYCSLIQCMLFLPSDPQISVGDENFHNNSYVTIGNNYPQEIVCSLNGIGVNEATVSWYYPNGLEVSTKEGLSGPYQVHRSGGRTIEAVMTWSPLPDATERASSFSGEGFYRCHIRTIVEVELDYYLGVYITEPGKFSLNLSSQSYIPVNKRIVVLPTLPVPHLE